MKTPRYLNVTLSVLCGIVGAASILIPRHEVWASPLHFAILVICGFYGGMLFQRKRRLATLGKAHESSAHQAQTTEIGRVITRDAPAAPQSRRW